MAETNESSTQLAQVDDAPHKVLPPHEWYGKLRLLRFSFTQGAAAGDAASSARLVRLPAGSVRVILPLSRIAHSALGSARTLDLGWEAYEDLDGDAVAADPNGLDDGVNVASAGNFNPGGTVGGDETYLFQSRGGVVLAAEINDGTIPAAATLKGYIAYVLE